ATLRGGWCGLSFPQIDIPLRTLIPVKYCPFPPGGGRLGWGAEAGTDSASHAWPHSHTPAARSPLGGRPAARRQKCFSYPPASRGQRGAAARGCLSALGTAGHPPWSYPCVPDHGPAGGCLDAAHHVQHHSKLTTIFVL